MKKGFFLQFMLISSIFLYLFILTNFQSDASGWNHRYFIRFDGLYRDWPPQQFITLGMRAENAIGMMGRHGGENGSVVSYLVVPGINNTIFEPNDFLFSKKQGCVDMIVVMNPLITTVKGVGPGSTCGQVWDAHGYDCTIATHPALGTGFYYAQGNYRIFFAVNYYSSPSKELMIKSVAVY
ncbi:MAG: hypothetical protein ABRQ39_17910 [Candidatus Eremiobacterota bacterium]